MRRRTVLVALAGLAVVLAAGAVVLWPDRADSDPSMVISEVFPTIHGRTVENGSAFDQAALDIGKYKKIVVPDSAAVRRNGKGDKLQIFMKKSLGFHGHPPESMSIRTAREHMGCAVKEQDSSLVLATFGEWDSHIEGGTRMDMKLLVPEGVEVEKRGGLSGEHSDGREWHGTYLTKPREVKEGWWYGPASPADGWRAVPDVPDPNRRASTP
jgi:hypothetical protein